jgi:hypothetical protein
MVRLSATTVSALIGVSLTAITGAAEAKPWKGAEMITQQTFLYGAFEARILAAKGSGMITPFFLYKDGSEVAGAEWEELDFEIFGKDGRFQTQAMTPGTNGSQRTEHVIIHDLPTLAWEHYYTFRMEWTPTALSFYVDGRLIRRETDAVTYAKLMDPNHAEPMRLRASIWAGDFDWSGAFDASAAPAAMFVNWIQTYSYTPGKGTGGSDFTPLWRDDLSSADGSRWYWANWTFDAAINDYIPQNSTTRNGYLVQVLTADTATGQFPTPPVDDGSVAQPPPPVISNPVALPARIEAEDYHRFVDTSGGNYGDAVCSNTDVDAQLTSDPTGGRCNVGWTAPGEWLEYDVSTASAAAYNLSLRVASDSIGPAMHVEIDGANVSGQLSVPSNGWQSFADLLTGPFMLSAGNHIVRLVFDTGNVNINYLVFNPPDAGTSLPATIQAESPNRFYDTSAANDGDAVCGKGALDVQVTDDAGGGGCAVAYVAPGEWLEYNVTSPQARTYDLTVRISSGMSGQTLHVEIDGHTIAGGSVVSPANGWQSFSDALIANVALAAGPHTVRLVFDTGYINADYLTFAAHSGG